MSDYEFTPVYCVQQETVDNLNGAWMRALQTAIPWLDTNNLTGFIHKRLKKFQEFFRTNFSFSQDKRYACIYTQGVDKL